MKRLILFAHYDPDNQVDPYVWHLLTSLKAVASRVMMVSVSALDEETKQALSEEGIECITKPNEGYDFMSWKTALDQIEERDEYDQIIFCNDSVYGPFFPLEEMFSVMEERAYDVWGLTDCHDIAYHLQSYFLVFSRKVFLSPSFEEFWNKVSILDDKHQIVERYEVGLTQHFLKAGFSVGVYMQPDISTVDAISHKWKRLSSMNPWQLIQAIVRKGFKASLRLLLPGTVNNTLTAWEALLKERCPFIKVYLFRVNPFQISLDAVYIRLEKETSYHVKWIKDHVARTKH